MTFPVSTKAGFGEGFNYITYTARGLEEGFGVYVRG